MDFDSMLSREWADCTLSFADFSEVFDRPERETSFALAADLAMSWNGLSDLVQQRLHEMAVAYTLPTDFCRSVLKSTWIMLGRRRDRPSQSSLGIQWADPARIPDDQWRLAFAMMATIERCARSSASGSPVVAERLARLPGFPALGHEGIATILSSNAIDEQADLTNCETEELLTRLASSLDRKQREALFAILAELMFHDGDIDEPEKQALACVRRTHEIPIPLAKELTRTAWIRNRLFNQEQNADWIDDLLGG